MAALAMPLGYAASPFLEVVHFTGGNQAYVIPGGRIARVRTCVSIISANFTGGVHSYITLKPHDDSQQFDVTGIDPGTAATITMYYIYSTEVGASSLVVNSGTVAYTSYNPLPLVTLFGGGSVGLAGAANLLNDTTIELEMYETGAAGGGDNLPDLTPLLYLSEEAA